MLIRLTKLELTCQRSVEVVELVGFSYFFGEIGSGKSTIAHLIDFCFGGKLIDTPALQNEFVSANLQLVVNGTPVSLSRNYRTHIIDAAWGPEGDEQVVRLPARDTNGVVIPDTDVENLSDFIYYLAGIKPTRVRRSQRAADSDLERMSFRDLYWYCYLDQDEIDSNFFHLGPNADTFKRLKSRNVLRFVLGFHQERVAELELELELVRRERIRSEDAARILKEALGDAGLSTEAEIAQRINQLNEKVANLRLEVETVRQDLESQRIHAADELRHQGQKLAAEMQAIENTIINVEEALQNDRRHLHELLNLSTKVKRVTAARAVLNGVSYAHCPRCTQILPDRDEDCLCPVCGQIEPSYDTAREDIEQTELDIHARKVELEEIITSQEDQRKRLGIRLRDLLKTKGLLDAQLNEALRQYDSAYLSAALKHERALAAREQEIIYLGRLNSLPAKVSELHLQAGQLLGKERQIRDQLRDSRKAAENDTKNIELLEKLFMDCLVRAKLPGFAESDVVKISSPWFLPEVVGQKSGDLATTSFGTLSSGGIKTMFKCCFALALHRLAAKTGAILPTVLVIDSPMKNISERENRAQFEGFHSLLYELASTELSETQFILIDKELCPPPSHGEFTRSFSSRHMRVDDENEPPLIGYYRDHSEREAPGQ